MKKHAVLVIVAACFFVLDRFLKVAALFKGTAIHNYNAAFSLSFGFDIAWLSAVVLLGAFAWLYYSLQKKDWLAASALIVLMLGASANFYDRLAYGFVVDYIEIPNLTVFNLADVLVVSGAILLALHELKKK